MSDLWLAYYLDNFSKKVFVSSSVSGLIAEVSVKSLFVFICVIYNFRL